MNRRLIGVLAIAGLLVLAAAPMASAHVTVNPGEAPKGGYTKLTFRVPNERDDAGTTRLEVGIPTDHPIRSVSVKPKQGWSYEVEKTKLDKPITTKSGDQVTEVVSKITWTGGVIKPGEFEEFDVSAGPLPDDADFVLFPAIQTYQGGEVVRWIDEPAAAGAEEPEHPAPKLTLVDPEAEEDAGAAAPPAASTSDASGSGAQGLTVANAATQDDVDGASTLGLVGIVVGILGLAVGGFALFRGVRGPGSTPASTDT
jgi:uncharacterized protein YcnI